MQSFQPPSGSSNSPNGKSPSFSGPNPSATAGKSWESFSAPGAAAPKPPTSPASKPPSTSVGVPPGRYPSPGADVKLPKKPIVSVLVHWFLKVSRFVFSPEFAVICGYSLAFGAVASAIIGYSTVLHVSFLAMKFPIYRFLGIDILAFGLGTLAALIMQYKELAPRQFKLFTGRADEAAWKAGRDTKVNPKETANTPSMLPTFKWFARNGDSMVHNDQKRDSFICYVLEGIGALLAIGKFLGNANPLIQIAALIWGLYSVFGCEFGIGHAEGAASRILTPDEEVAYQTEKQRSN